MKVVFLKRQYNPLLIHLNLSNELQFSVQKILDAAHEIEVKLDNGLCTLRYHDRLEQRMLNHKMVPTSPIFADLFDK